MLKLFQKRSESSDSNPELRNSTGGIKRPGAAPPANRLRVGFFEDLTTLPLVHTFDASVRVPGGTRRAPVQTIREAVERDELEVALLPVADFMAHASKLCLVPGGCVSTVGASNLFLLCSKVLPTEIHKILVDKESLGARTLAEVVLPSRLSIRPEFIPSPVSLDPRTFNFDRDPHDAYLICGENALLVNRHNFISTFDLTQLWVTMTQTPYVFHVWCVRRGVNLKGLEDEIETLTRNLRAAQMELATREGERLGFPAESMLKIFRYALRSDFTGQEVSALRTYAKYLTQARVLTTPVQFLIYQAPKKTK